MAVRVEDHGAVRVVTIDRPEVRNAVDGPTAQLLYDIFVDFEADDSQRSPCSRERAERSVRGPI